MGRIIAKRIRGMNWKSKISLILVFAMIFSMFIYQGWYKPKFSEAAATANGTVVYNNNNVNPPVYRNYAVGTNTFAAAANLSNGATNQTFFVNKRSSMRDENIAGYVTTAGALYILRWNGSAWSAAWGPITVGGTGINGRRFDIAYEKTSGNAMVVYSNNTTGLNELRYNVWNGSAWSGAQTLNAANITGTPAWIKMASRSTAGSNELAATVMDTTGRLTTLRWNGTDWTTLAESSEHTGGSFLLRSATYGDYDVFDTAYEGLTGNLMVVWTQTGPAQYWRTCAAGGAWNAATATGTARTTDVMFVAADPNSNNMVAGWFRDTRTDVYGMAWDGSAWGAATIIGTLGANYTVAVNKSRMTAGWATAGGKTAALVAWNNSSQLSRVDYNTFTVGTGWGTATSYTTAAAGIKAWMDMDRDPLSGDTLMLTFSDANNDLWAKRFVYDGSAFAGSQADGGTALTATLGTVNTNKNFDFEYTIPPPSLTIGEGTNPSSANAPRSTTNNALDGFTMNMSNGTGTVTSLTVLGSANFTSTNIPTNGVKVWRDTGTTVGAWDAGDTQISTASTAIASNQTNVTISSEPVTTTPVNYLVTVDITAGATLTNTFTATISNAGGTGLGTPVDNDATSATLTVTAVQTLTVGNGTNPASATAFVPSSNNALDAFTMALSAGSGSVNTLTLTGSANFTTTNISNVKIYRDNGTVGTFDGADVLVPTTYGHAGTVATISFTTPEAVTTSTVNYLVLVDTASGAAGSGSFTGTITTPATGTGLSSVTYNDSASATLTLKLASSISSCGGCHAYPPQDGTRSGTTGAAVGDHQVGGHQAVCSTCHVTPAGETSAYYGHRNANINMKTGATGISSGFYDKDNSGGFNSPADETWAQTNTVTTRSCRNISCHGGSGGNSPTAVWGVGTVSCIDCHSGAVDAGDGGQTRRAMSTEFTTYTWSHKRTAGSWTANDCGVCHMEGDPSTGKTTSYHKNDLLEFRDPDTGSEIEGVSFSGTPGSYTSTGSVVPNADKAAFSRNTNSNTLEPLATAVMINMCLKCHDSNGATAVWVPSGSALRPFNTAPTHTPGNNVLDVNAHFATSNASYHPIRGKQNNWYADADTLNTPWNQTTRGGGANNTTYGDLMTCWDCHDSSSANRTIGGANASVIHGNAQTLRAAYTLTAGSSTAICVICHKTSVYWTTYTHNTALTGVSALDNVADGSWTSRHDIGEGNYFGCGVCHGTNSSATKPARPLPAENTHGFNTLASGATTWTSGASAWGFLRNNTNMGDWDNSPGTCNMNGSGNCEGYPSYTYSPGGTY